LPKEEKEDIKGKLERLKKYFWEKEITAQLQKEN